MAIKSEIFKRKEKLEIQNMRRDKDNKTNFKKKESTGKRTERVDVKGS